MLCTILALLFFMFTGLKVTFAIFVMFWNSRNWRPVKKSFHKITWQEFVNTLLYNWHLCCVHSYHTIHSFLTCCNSSQQAYTCYFSLLLVVKQKVACVAGERSVHRLNKKRLEFAEPLSNRWSSVLCIHKYPFYQKKIVCRFFRSLAKYTDVPISWN